LGVVVVAVVVVKIRVLSEVCCREGGGSAWILFILRILSFARRHGLILSSCERCNRPVGAAPEAAALSVVSELPLLGLLGPKPWAAKWQLPEVVPSAWTAIQPGA
jgi:hypothetical protein